MHTTTSSVSITKPAINVWQALTDTTLVKQWQYGSELTTDWQVGSPIRFHNEWEGQSFDQWGEVLSYQPYSLIKYSLFVPRPDLEDKPENYFVMTYKLQEVAGNTQLTIMQDDPRPGAGEDEDNDAGNAILSALKQLVESA